MDPIVLSLVVIGAVAVAGVGLLLRAILRAPLGYQDVDGFHFGAPRVAARRTAMSVTRPRVRAGHLRRRNRRSAARAA